MDSGPSQIIYALAPLRGSPCPRVPGGTPRLSLMAVEAAAITPSLLYTFVFNNLVTVARRRRPEGGAGWHREDEQTAGSGGTRCRAEGSGIHAARSELQRAV